MPGRQTGRARLFAAAAAVAVADLTIKAAAGQGLSGRGLVDLPGPLDLRLFFNPGAAFGPADQSATDPPIRPRATIGPLNGRIPITNDYEQNRE